MTETEFKKNDIVSAYCEEYQTIMDAEIVDFRHHKQQAYVHFIKQDKRLDRWMDISSLSHSTEQNTSKQEEHVLSRNQRKLLEESDSDEEGASSEFVQFEKVHREVTKIRNIDFITIGKYTIRSWYYAPYPPPFYKMDHIFICEHCFSYFESQVKLQQHLQEKNELCPPGREIYRDGNLSVFELKGKRQKLACQNLCLLSKLFLDHKTLFYDVEGFIFYVLCEYDDDGSHIAAYFSRELNSAQNNILACITTLPPYQKRGYGHFLISLAYEIAKRQHRTGGPERPLSDLGKIAFHAYWRDTILNLLKNQANDITSVDTITSMTAIDRFDVIDTLKEVGLITKVKGEYDLNLNKDALSNALAAVDFSKQKRRIDPSKLIWLHNPDEND